MNLTGDTLIASIAAKDTSMDEMRPMLREKCRKSLFFLAKAVLGFSDMIPRIHLPMCDLAQSKDELRILELVPRGCFKSSCVTISLPIWWLIQEPDGKYFWGPNERILIANAAATNAEHFLRRIEAVFETNELFRWLFPELLPTSKCKWSNKEMEVPRSKSFPEATIETIGVGGRIVSRHYTKMILDDLIEKEASESETIMKSAIDWFMYTEDLLEVPSRDKQIVLGTRWAVDDLYSHIQENDSRFTIYQKQALNDGQSHWPERFSTAELLAKQRRDPVKFALQQQNDPIDPTLVEFQIDWLQYYVASSDKQIQLSDGSKVDPNLLSRVILVDPALSKAKTACDTALVVVGVDHLDRIFILDVWSKVSSWDVYLEQLADMSAYWGGKIAIENVLFSRLLEPLLKPLLQKRGIWAPIELVRPDTNKTARIRALTPIFAEKRVFIHRRFGKFIEQYSRFPQHMKKIDILDAFAMGPKVWKTGEAPKTEKELTFEEFYETAGVTEGKSPITGY